MYRRLLLSAYACGMTTVTPSTRAATIATVVSVLALPLGVLILFSFGGQLILGPFVLAIEWILAKLSPAPLRIAWSILAGALVGEIVYILLDVHVGVIDGFPAVTIGLVAAALTGLLIFRTTESV